MSGALARPWSDEFRKCAAKPDLSVSQWADRYRVIPLGTSVEAGPWRTSRTPYLREILDAVSDPEITSVTIQAGSQLGKTEVILCAIGYYAEHEPAAMLIVQPDEKVMRDFSKTRIGAMFTATPVLRGKVAEGARDPNNTITLRQFPGGYLACGWAGSAASLASRSIRILFADEVDRWPESTGDNDGDPWAQAVQRTVNHRRNKKIIAVSTPTRTGASRIARLYEGTDRRQFHVPCPRCGVLQVLTWRNVIYKVDGVVALEQIHYRCAHCEERIEEREKTSMIADPAAAWMPGPRRSGERPASPSARGYQISAIYSPWITWSDLAEEWIRAHENRDSLAKQAFINLKLGETWDEESERISVEALEKNRAPLAAEVADDALILTAGVDVQDNRLECEVVGWGLGKESWGVEYVIIGGDTSTADPWERLDVFLQRSWAKADGRSFTLSCVCVDSGGHRTQEVYEFCGARLARRIFATKGRAGMGRPIVDKQTLTNQARINLYPVGADTGKELVYSRLALAKPGPGYCHFPIGRGYDDQFFKGLVAEQRVWHTNKRTGRKEPTWHVTGRNEPLDIRVLATAALELLWPDVDGSRSHLPTLHAAELVARGGGQTPKPPATRRRVISRGVE